MQAVLGLVIIAGMVVFAGDWILRRLYARRKPLTCDVPPVVDVEGISRATDQLLRQIGGRA